VNCADIAIDSSTKGGASAFISKLKKMTVANLVGYTQGVQPEGDGKGNFVGIGPSAQEIQANSGGKAAAMAAASGSGPLNSKENNKDTKNPTCVPMNQNNPNTGN
jgi:hypothetical protein